MKPPNPWDVTDRQAEVMDAVCEHGCQKLAARALGLSSRTVENHCHAVGVRMGERTLHGRYLRWDRARRATAGSAAPEPTR